MNIRSKVKVRDLGLGDRVAGVSYAPLSSAPLTIGLWYDTMDNVSRKADTTWNQTVQ